MPRAAKTPSSPTPSSPNASPRKAPRARKPPAKTPAPVDPSLWRASKIPQGTTINKADAIKRYHLNAKDVEGLKFRTTETVVRDVKRQMFLYQERDIERKAWERYGSPELFEQMLATKRAKYREKHGSNPPKPFPEPSSYARSGCVTIVHASAFRNAAKGKYDASTPKLLDMKQKLQREGKEWLWKAIIDAYNRSLDEDEFNYMRPGKQQEEDTILPALKTVARDYPDEPRYPEDAAMAASPSFDELRRVLVDAPVWGEEQAELAQDGEPVDGFKVTHISWPYDDYNPDWTREYLKRVYDALSGVIAEHGPRGWTQARWLVHDRYAECNLGRITWTRDRGELRWYDGGLTWLYADTYKKYVRE